MLIPGDTANCYCSTDRFDVGDAKIVAAIFDLRQYGRGDIEQAQHVVTPTLTLQVIK